MTQLANQLPIASPAPGRWLDLDTASRRSGKSVGHLRRLCGQQWLSQGLAKMDRGPAGKSTWFIVEQADPMFAPIRAPETIEFDWSPYTAEQRRELVARKQIVIDWDEAVCVGLAAGKPKAQVTTEFLDALKTQAAPVGRTLAQRTLYYWRDGWRQSGYAGLVDNRWKAAPREESEFTQFFEELRRWYLDQNEPSIRICYKIAKGMALRHGWKIPHYATAARHLQTLSTSQKIYHRRGPEEWNNRCNAYIERDYTTLRSNQIWCGDHHPCDVIVRYQGRLVRPWLTAWEDMRSRKLVGYKFFCGDPNSDTIVAAFRHGVKLHGVPEMAYVDNGKDYDCYALQGVTKSQRWAMRKVHIEHDVARFGGMFGALGVQVMHAPPYHPQSKPIERFFRTFEDQFDRLEPTYCGNKPEEKPEWLQDRLDRGMAPEFEDWHQRAIRYLEEEYHLAGHRGQGMDGQAPADVWTQCLETKRTAPDDVLDLWTLPPSKPIQVGRNGVKIDGRTYVCDGALLDQHFGRQVRLRIDEDDISAAVAFDLEDRPICRLRWQQPRPVIGVTKQEFRQAKAANKRKREDVKKGIQQQLRMTTDPLEEVILARAEERRRQAEAAPAGSQPTPPAPPSIQPIQTPAIEAFKSLQKSLEPQRLAVGAERSATFNSLRDAFKPAPAAERAPLPTRNEDLADRFRIGPRPVAEPDAGAFAALREAFRPSQETSHE